MTDRIRDARAVLDPLIQGTGLGHLPDIVFDRHDHALITAFLEHWHPETNSFHFREGEFTITLEDVQQILGIPCGETPVRFITPQVIPFRKYRGFLII